MQKNEERERACKEKWARETGASRRHQQFVEQVIYQELTNLSTKNEDERWLFFPQEAEEIIRRCEELGGKVFCISHFSESGEHDEILDVSPPTPAKQAPQELRDKGCNEKFSVTVRIPPEVVERRKQQRPD